MSEHTNKNILRPYMSKLQKCSHKIAIQKSIFLEGHFSINVKQKSN